MLSRLGWYYIWKTQFSILERKILIAVFSRTIIEYSGYFILLAHHHSVAMLLFQTSSWYPSTLYFEIIFCITVLTSFIFTWFLLANYLLVKRSIIFMRLSFFAQAIYLSFCALGAGWLHLYLPDLVMFGFIVISVLYVLLSGCEKFITVTSLLGISISRAKYLFVTQAFFLSITLGLFIASFCMKAAVIGAKHHINEMKMLIFPLFLLSILCGIYDCFLLKERINIWIPIKLEYLMSAIKHHSQEITARIMVNLMIGIFLVKWYFNIPFLLQYGEKWSADAIANLVLLCGIVSIVGGIIFKYIFERVNIYRLFAYTLFGYLVLVMLINVNLYYHHWITFSVLSMALLYNFLNGIINKIVHHNYFDFAINTLLLVFGSTLGIVIFSFLSSSLSIFFAKQIGIFSRPVENILTMLMIITVGCYGFYKMRHSGSDNEP